MFKRQLKCKTCGTRFDATKDNHYIVRANSKTGLTALISENYETQLYDAFECPVCGCQVITQERKYSFDPKSSEEIAKKIKEIANERESED